MRSSSPRLAARGRVAALFCAGTHATLATLVAACAGDQELDAAGTSPTAAIQTSTEPPPAPPPSEAAGVGTETPEIPAPPVEAPPAGGEPDASPSTLSNGVAIAGCDAQVANMSCIPGGTFVVGSDTGPENARPAHRVELQTFYMDVFEVTYVEYKDCVREGKCPKGGPFYLDFNRPHQPITGMTWIGADAYCKAQGKRLPSEAQWEAAARGPDGERFPWGDEPATCKKAIIKGPAGRACGVNKIGETPWKGRPFIVGSRPAYRYGLHDMAGNSWEYVSDWASPSFEACGAACQGIDPLGPCAGQDTCEGTNSKVVKGGSWYYPAEYAEAVFRREQPPNNRPFHHLGFRCAASIDEATALHGVPARANAPKVGMKNPDAKL